MILDQLEKIALSTVCKEKQNTYTVTRLASHMSQPSGTMGEIVTRLASRKLVFLTAPKRHGNRFIKLTDKGECAAIVDCGVDFATLVENHPYLEPEKQTKYFKRCFSTPELATKAMQWAGRYFLDHDYFSSEGQNTISKTGNRYMQKSMLTEWIMYVEKMALENPGLVDTGKFRSYTQSLTIIKQA